MSQVRDVAGVHALVWLAAIIAAVCVVWLLRAASAVMVPLATAFFVAIAVQPVHHYLERRGPSQRWVAPVLTMAFITAILGGGIWAIAESIDEAVEAAPRYAGQLQQVRTTLEAAAREYGLPLPSTLFDAANVSQRLAGFLEAAARTAMEIVAGLVLVFFLVVLMLLEAVVWRDNTRRAFHDARGRMALETVAQVAGKIRGYLYVRTMLGLASAVAAGVWLFVLDVDLVLVWVVLTFLLNYIPNIGSIIAVLPPSLLAMLQHGPLYGAIVLGGLALFEQIIGNFIDPRMQGRRLHLSPVLVLTALVFWTWMWGPVGALLAVPMTVALLAAAEHVPALRPFVTLAAAEHQHPAAPDASASTPRNGAA
jgi:AI-2 transport protein TqsA